MQSRGDLLKELLLRLSLKECIEHLMNGYLRQNASESQYSMYQFYLQQISIEYLGGINFYIGFKISSDITERVELKNEHYVCITDDCMSWATLSTDLPTPVKNTDCNFSWNAKLNAPSAKIHAFIGICPGTFNGALGNMWYYVRNETEGCNRTSRR